MKLTIDSDEPLERVLAVVGSMYRLELVVKAESTEAPTETPAVPEATAAAAPRGRGGNARGGRRRASTPDSTPSPTPAGAPDSAKVRAWARENDVAVSPRGRLSGTVLKAYQDAQK